MVFEKYGETFKELRIQLGRKREDFERIGISRAALTKFENGKSMMGFDRVTYALEELGVSLEEFEYLTSDYSVEYREKLLNIIEKSLYLEDRRRIKEIINFASSNQDIILEIVAKIVINDASDEEIETLTSYLYEINNWGYFELYSFYLTLEYFNVKDTIYIIEKFLEKFPESLRFDKFKMRLIYILYKASAISIYKGNKAGAYFLMNRFEPEKGYEYMFATNIKNLVNGFYIFKFDNNLIGKQKVFHSLELLNELCDENIYYYFTKRYSEFLEINIFEVQNLL